MINERNDYLFQFENDFFTSLEEDLWTTHTILEGETTICVQSQTSSISSKILKPIKGDYAVGYNKNYGFLIVIKKEDL